MRPPRILQCKRVYDAREDRDGYRVLVDRVWPRGMNKEQVAADSWYQQLAPSTPLRLWFGHDPDRWKGFLQRYREELREKRDAIDTLIGACDGRSLTLLYAARDTEHNNAVALKIHLEHWLAVYRGS